MKTTPLIGTWNLAVACLQDSVMWVGYAGKQQQMGASSINPIQLAAEEKMETESTTQEEEKGKKRDDGDPPLPSRTKLVLPLPSCGGDRVPPPRLARWHTHT